jgi:hypothetical protein
MAGDDIGDQLGHVTIDDVTIDADKLRCYLRTGPIVDHASAGPIKGKVRARPPFLTSSTPIRALRRDMRDVRRF